jgi:hypothetical protein
VQQTGLNKQGNPKEIGSIVFALGNGTGKTRANRPGLGLFLGPEPPSAACQGKDYALGRIAVAVYAPP